MWCFSGYLHLVCKLLKENLEKMPGDLRTQIGFITFDSTVHFYSLKVSNDKLECPDNSQSPPLWSRVLIRHRRSENSPSTTQNSPAKFRSFPEAKLFYNNSPVTLRCSPATTILNENPDGGGQTFILL